MCAVICSSLFLIFIYLHTTLVTEGLPLNRRERGTQDDLIAGKDFLSVLMESPALHRPNRETITPSPSPPLATLPTSLHLGHGETTSASVTREIRSTRFAPLIDAAGRTSLNSYRTELIPGPVTGDKVDDRNVNEKLPDSRDGRLIITVRVSSSVQEAPNNLNPSTKQSLYTELTTESITVEFDNNKDLLLSSEEQPNVIAEANKSDFSVEEMTPITRNSEELPVQFVEDLPANVQALPSLKKISDFEQNSELLKELSRSDNLKDTLRPFHHTVIYHDNTKQDAAERTVSYSSSVQSGPQASPTTWETDELKQEIIVGSDMESFSSSGARMKLKAAPTSSSVAESKDYYVTNKYNPADYNESIEKNLEDKEVNWEKSEEPYVTRKDLEPTENNQGTTIVKTNSNISPSSVPTVYGMPEQNYEVDEAVSVQTSGRAHGVQPNRPVKPVQNGNRDEKKKVGYVLEGRKERRYRVEERTSDGFIVGEYGVVNHDDGLLRGVRYTADGTISPRLIYDTLMKFLSL